MEKFQLNKLSIRFILWMIGISFIQTGSAQLPLDSSFLILSPRFFPGWQAQHVSCPFVFFDTTANQYKMYYSGSSSTQVNQSLWDQWVTGAVTSENTLDWNYPDNYEQVLFARKFMEGDVVNPDEIAKIFDAVFAVDPSIIKDGSVYKCWYTGWNGQIQHTGDGLSKKINFRIGYATSSDGITWSKLKGNAGAGSVLGLGEEEGYDKYGVQDPCVIKENGVYRMWYAGYDGEKRRIEYAVSPDGINWTKKGVVFNPGAKGAPDENGVESPVVIRRAGKYELWYLGKSSSSPYYHVLRALSSDGINWKKAGEVPLHPRPPLRPGIYSPWSSIADQGNGKLVLGSIIVQPDNSCQVFYAKQYSAQKKATYAVINTPLSFIYTERVNP